MTEPVSVTLIVSDAGAEGDQLKRTTQQWTASGLLAPSIWLDHDRVAKAYEANDVKGLQAETIGPGAEATVLPVITALAGREYDVVRLAAVRLLDSTESPTQAEPTEWLATTLRGELPNSTALIRFNVLVPGEASGEALTHPGWEANVVVSPEDRASPDAINEGLHDRDRYVAHAALACATVTGLWMGSGSGPLDAGSGNRVGNEGRIVVARSFARVVDSRSLPDRVVDRLVTGTAAHHSVEPAEFVRDEQALVTRAVGGMLRLERNGFSFHPYPRSVSPPRPSSRTSIRTLFGALRELFRVRHPEFEPAAVARLSESAENWVKDSVETDGDSTEEKSVMAPPSTARLHEWASMAPPPVDEPAATIRAQMPNNVNLWQPLRQACFGLIDGGQLPEEVSGELGNQAVRLRAARRIVPPPEDVLRISESERVALEDAGVSAVADLRPIDQNEATRLSTLIAEFLEQSKAERKAGTPDATGEDGDGSRSAAEQRGDDDVPGPDATLIQLEHRIARWKRKDGRADSLFGQLAQHVSDQILLAREQLRLYAQRYKVDSQRRHAELVEKLNDAALRARQLAWPSVLFAVAVLVLYALDVRGVLGLDAGATAGLAAALLAAMVFLVVVLAWYVSRRARLEQEIVGIEENRRHVVAAIQHWPTEADRLSSVYEQLMEWAEVVGWMLYHPYGQDHRRGHTADTTDLPGRPRAFQYGLGNRSDDEFRGLQHRTSVTVFDRGWIRDLYAQVKERSMQRLRSRTGNLDESLPDPDASPTWHFSEGDDLVSAGADEGNSRQSLLNDFRTQRCAADARDFTAAAIREFVDKIPVVALAPDMRLVSTDEQQPAAGPARMDPTQFLAALVPAPRPLAPGSVQLSQKGFTDEGAMQGRRDVETVTLWTSNGLAQDIFGTEPAAPQSETLSVVELPTVDVSPGLYRLIVRLDLSADCDPAEVDLLAGGSGRR